MKRWILPLALLIMVFVFTSPASAKALTVEEVGSKLVCTCGCDNMLVNVCTCDSATKVKDTIRKRIVAGASLDQILDEFVEAYGEKVLAEPRRKGFNLLAWLIPIAGIGFSGGAIFYLVRKWSKETPKRKKKALADKTLAKKYQKRLEKDLEEWE
ncbi:MAG: cytochrome c-type biogenesis protein CcmH [Actinomycetota bacterium]